MKIKILKDIPEYKYKIGSVIDVSSDRLIGVVSSYAVEFLIQEGYAEEVKDEIDIETIRQNLEVQAPKIIFNDKGIVTSVLVRDTTPDELRWFSAYRVVSEVIRQLNGDWIADWNNGAWDKYIIAYDYVHKLIIMYYEKYRTSSMIIPCKDQETAQKVIDLCQPELLTLFRVK